MLEYKKVNEVPPADVAKWSGEAPVPEIGSRITFSNGEDWTVESYIICERWLGLWVKNVKTGREGDLYGAELDRENAARAEN